MLTSFVQQEMEREVIKTKFLAQQTILSINPENNSVITDLNNLWTKFISLSYGLDPASFPGEVKLTEETMRAEYERVKNLKLSLRKRKDGGIEVVGFPAKDERAG